MQPDELWDEHDFLLHEAYAILESERCNQCGIPRYICHNDDPNVEFEMVEDSCVATARKDQFEESERLAGGDNYKIPAGTTVRPNAFLVDGGDPASVRDSFYQKEWEKRQMLADELNL